MENIFNPEMTILEIRKEYHKQLRDLRGNPKERLELQEQFRKAMSEKRKSRIPNPIQPAKAVKEEPKEKVKEESKPKKTRKKKEENRNC